MNRTEYINELRSKLSSLSEEDEGVKNSFSTFKTLALYILALPVGLPLALIFFAVTFAVLVTVFALFM